MQVNNYEKEKKHYKTVLSNSLEVLISKTLIHSCISHLEILVNNVSKEYNDIKNEIKSLRT